jgi:hypothetical protein
VGFPGVVARRASNGVWQVLLRRDAPHPEEEHVGRIRAAFHALELVDGRLRAYGRTATGEPMNWEQRGQRWVAVELESERIPTFPAIPCGPREIPSSAQRSGSSYVDVSGFSAGQAPAGHRYGRPSAFCVDERVFAWAPLLDSGERERGGLLGWQHGERWASAYLPLLDTPVGGLEAGEFVVIIANGASVRWSSEGHAGDAHLWGRSLACTTPNATY